MIWLGTIDPTLELAFGQWLNAECVQSVDSSYLERLSLGSLCIDNIRSLTLMFPFSKCCSSKLSQERIVFWTFFSWQPSRWGLLCFPPLSLNKGELSYRYSKRSLYLQQLRELDPEYLTSKTACWDRWPYWRCLGWRQTPHSLEKGIRMYVFTPNRANPKPCLNPWKLLPNAQRPISLL